MEGDPEYQMLLALQLSAPSCELAWELMLPVPGQAGNRAHGDTTLVFPLAWLLFSGRCLSVLPLRLLPGCPLVDRQTQYAASVVLQGG